MQLCAFYELTRGDNRSNKYPYYGCFCEANILGKELYRHAYEFKRRIHRPVKVMKELHVA